MSLSLLTNDIIESLVRFARRLPSSIRDCFDDLFKECIVCIAQCLINLWRKDEKLAIAEEKLLPNEAEITRNIIDAMNEVTARRYNTRVAYRAGNTKTYGLLKAEFTVLDNLPGDLRVGVFKESKTYPCWLRMAGPGPVPTPDPLNNGILSISIKLMGVEGEKLLDDEKYTQDFLGISAPTFTTPNIIENQKLQKHIGKGTPVFYFINPFDSHFLDAIMQGIYAKNHASPLEVRYYSCVPYLFGEGRAIQYSFVPQSRAKSELPKPLTDQYLREAMVETLSGNDVYFDFMIQFQTNSHKMPIENASVRWPRKLSPYVRIATIKIPKQSFISQQQDEFARFLSFNPWHSLPELRPLGNQNRARKHIYLETSKFRQQIGGDKRVEPTETEQFS